MRSGATDRVRPAPARARLADATAAERPLPLPAGRTRACAAPRQRRARRGEIRTGLRGAPANLEAGRPWSSCASRCRCGASCRIAKVEGNRGRVAIERGPIVYCVEGADHDGKVLDLYLPDEVALTPEHRPDLLGGVTVLTGEAERAHRADDGSVASQPAKLTMIPYYAWCHRGANEMAVWLPRSIERTEVSTSVKTPASGVE